MGITGELVRNVFLKSRSVQRHDSHARSNAGEKKRWRTSVRSYLCGDEHNSTFAADDDSSSFRSMNVTSFTSIRVTRGGDISSVQTDEDSISVNQPLQDEQSDENRGEKCNSACKLFQQEDAAMIIQSAFRSFLARRASTGLTVEEDKDRAVKGNPSRESIGTSIEVQTGNSDMFSIPEECFSTCHPMRHKTRAQVLKLQEDWDDSTVSSNIAKMRSQSKLEAATRRERALAYAFSQQLRICSKKKQGMINGNEANVGWNWLERWMAARQTETMLTDDQMSTNRKIGARKRLLDAATEEKESCGSNEVSSLFEVNVMSVPRNVPRPPAKSRIKINRNLSRQNSASSHLSPRDSKDVKKVCHMADEKEKRKRSKQPGNKRDGKPKDATAVLELEANL